MKTILPLPLWAIFVCVAIILLPGCATTNGIYEEVKRSPDVYVVGNETGNRVRIFDKPCPDAPDWLDLRLAEMTYEGKELQACWTAMGPYIIVFDVQKDKSPIPKAAFRKEPTT